MDDMDDVLKELENDENPVKSAKTNPSFTALKWISLFTLIITVASGALGIIKILSQDTIAVIFMAVCISSALFLASIRVLRVTTTNADEKNPQKEDNDQKGK